MPLLEVSHFPLPLQQEGIGIRPVDPILCAPSISLPHSSRTLVGHGAEERLHAAEFLGMVLKDSAQEWLSPVGLGQCGVITQAGSFPPHTDMEEI